MLDFLVKLFRILLRLAGDIIQRGEQDAKKFFRAFDKHPPFAVGEVLYAIAINDNAEGFFFTESKSSIVLNPKTLNILLNLQADIFFPFVSNS